MQGLWAGAWLKDVVGYERPQIAYALLTMAFALSIGAIVGGLLSSHLRRLGISFQTTMTWTALMAMSAEFCLILEAPIAPLVSWSIVGATSAATVIGFSFNAEHFDRAILARANACLSIAHMLAAFAIQAGFGLILDLWKPGPDGAYPREAYSAGLAAILVIQALALVQFWATTWRLRTASVPAGASSAVAADSGAPSLIAGLLSSGMRALGHLPAIAALMGFQILGEALVTAGQLKFPGSLLGMLLLLGVLIVTRGAGQRLTAVSLQLARLIGLMVLPAGAAVAAVATTLGSDLTGISVSLLVSTLIGIAVTGITANLVSPRPASRLMHWPHRTEPGHQDGTTAKSLQCHGFTPSVERPVNREDVEAIFLKPEPHDLDYDTLDRPYT